MDFAFTVDHLTLIMLGVVTGVGFLIHVYSVGYMAHEDGYWRFFAYLNLFMFFMLVLVLSSSFLLLFVGWEGVGLASYLLIGFYFKRDSAANAGKKAFITNRVGDWRTSARLAVARCFRRGTRSRAPSPAASLPPSVFCLFLAPQASPRRFLSIYGCRTPWKAPRRSLRSSTPLLW